MAWLKLISEQDFERLIEGSKHSAVIIFKHSTRCSISAMALRRMNEASKLYDIHIIDIIQHRDISNMIAQKLRVTHQSPQLLIVKSGNCSFHASHMQISVNLLHEQT